MIGVPTAFPYVGSYALLVDEDAPPPQSTELVRIQWRREGFVMVAFPLRDGASGNKAVPFDQLIDASPLSPAESRELRELDRALIGREPRNLSKAQRAKAKRRAALRRRVNHGPILDRLLRFADQRRARQRRAA